MKRISLSKKIVGIVVVSVAVVGLSLTVCTNYFLNKIYNDESRQEVARLAGLVQSHVDDEARKLAVAAQMTAARQDLAEAISRGDTAAVQKLGKDIMRDSRISLITIADKEGKVVGRGHSDKAGDSVLSQSNVRKALGGEVSTGIEEGTVVKFSMRAGAPVKLGDKIVGSVTTGTDLTSADHAFVEKLKKEFGTECTIFQGDTRVTHDAHEGRPAGRGDQDGQPEGPRHGPGQGTAVPGCQHDPGKGIRHGLLAREGSYREDRGHALHRQGPGGHERAP